MQRSLLPRTRPRMAGLEIGAIYESSALVGVGGDIYDYLQTGDDRLAIVLGDVTGHGIDAAADMAMAKFVFRSLARLYPEPGAFLACGERRRRRGDRSGQVHHDAVPDDRPRHAARSPAPRPVTRRRDCSTRAAPSPVSTRKGSSLGIEPGIEYCELRRPFEPGASAVLYTDGLVEARRAGEMYGEERLDRVLAANHELPPEQLAAVALEECRRWVAGDLRGRLRDRRRAAYVNLLKAGRPFRVGHKGAAALEPENTLRSLRRGVELGCDLIEFDVLDLARRDARARALGRPARGQPRRGRRAGAGPDSRLAPRGRARASDLRRGAGAARRDGRRSDCTSI